MKIIMALSDNPFPPDIRVEKEAKTLLGDEHQIHLVAINKMNEQKDEEKILGIHVHRQKSLHLPVIWANYEANRLLISLRILKAAIRYGCDAIHVHDLPMALPSLIVARILNKPVVVDLHENYPEMFYYDYKRRWKGKKSIRSLRTKLMKLEEKLVVRNASHIIAVVEEMKNRLVSMGAQDKKITVISNTADISKMRRLSINNAEDSLSPGFKLVYVGGISHHRGLHTLITAVKHIVDKIPNIHLYLVGDGVAKESLIELTHQLGLESHVTFAGHQPFEKAMRYVIQSDACVIPYVSYPQTKASFPHKLTQYMYFKKPLIVSNVKSLKRIVESKKCGVVFKAEDSHDLAQKTMEIYEKPERAKIMGNNGHKAVMEEYNWETDGKKLIQLYQGIWRGSH